MKLVRNKILKFSLIWALLLSLSSPICVNAAGAGIFSGITEAFKSFTGLFVNYSQAKTANGNVSTGIGAEAISGVSSDIGAGVGGCVLKPKSSGWGVLAWTVGISAVVAVVCGSLFLVNKWKKAKAKKEDDGGIPIRDFYGSTIIDNVIITPKEKPVFLIMNELAYGLSDEKNDDLNITKERIKKIKKFFNGVRLGIKQYVLEGFVELYTKECKFLLLNAHFESGQAFANKVDVTFTFLNDPNNIKTKLILGCIEEFYKKIKFDWAFLTHQEYKFAVKFAQDNRILDRDRRSVLEAQLIYCKNRELSNVFETNGALQTGLVDKKNVLTGIQKKAKADYENALKYVMSQKNKKRLIDLENTRIIANNFSGKTCPDTAFRIIGFTDIDFGDKIDGEEFSTPAVAIAN